MNRHAEALYRGVMLVVLLAIAGLLVGFVVMVLLSLAADGVLLLTLFNAIMLVVVVYLLGAVDRKLDILSRIYDVIPP